MPNKSYSPDFKLRCVALASVRSIPVASKELGVPEDTLTRWVAKQPQTAALEQAVNLALSELTARMAAGTLSPRDLTVAYGVLRDKQARYGKVDDTPPITAADQWCDDIEAALLERHKGHAATAMVALIEWFDTFREPDGPVPPVADCLTYLEGLGDLEAWRDARAAATHDAMLVQLERNKAIAAEWTRKALDAETQQILAEAEMWLAAHAESTP